MAGSVTNIGTGGRLADTDSPSPDFVAASVDSLADCCASA
jgi:hypothetical protein